MSEVILCDRCKKEIDCSKGFYNTPVGRFHSFCWSRRKRSITPLKMRQMTGESLARRLIIDINKGLGDL